VKKECVALIVWVVVVAPPVWGAQTPSASDREAMVRLHEARGGTAEEVDALLRVAGEAASKGLPATPVTNKIREGLAKGARPAVIESVIRQMTMHLESADRLAGEMTPAPEAAARERFVTLVAESLGSGVTTDEIRELRRLGQPSGGPPPAADAVATAAKGLALIKDARLPAADASAVIVEALRQGFRPVEVLDVGREVKRRENDYRAGRATLQALRDAIARGERPEQLFRASPVEAPDRPAQRSTERPAVPPETATRPERPVRPEARPEPTERPERTQRPEPPPRRP
jgi:hypothetical protein